MTEDRVIMKNEVEPLPASAAPEAAPRQEPERVVSPILFVRVRDGLRLEGYQVSYVAAALREREAEIRACHDRYRAAGVFDVRDYQQWVQERKGFWFLRIDAVLEPAQRQQFLAEVEKGLLSEGLEFEVGEGMTILD
jgi:hypothetical protein